jgi:RES domain
VAKQPQLQPPPADFATWNLETKEVDPSTLYRISGHLSGEPYFGRSADKRFDDPSVDATTRYGVCYLGRRLSAAFAETVLHNEVPVNGEFTIAETEIARRFLVRFEGTAPLSLANFTGSGLRNNGATAELTTTPDYDLSQQWSAATHAHPQDVDGILYMSRQLNTGQAVALFARAARKLRHPVYTPLDKVRGLNRAIEQFRIRWT